MTEVSTSMQKTAMRFNVSFDGVSGFPAGIGEYTDSPPVTFCDRTWVVRLYPGGNGAQNTGFASCFLLKTSGEDSRASFSFTVSELPTGPTSMEKHCTVTHFTAQEPQKGFPQFLTTRYLRNPEGFSHIQNDILVLTVDLVIFGEIQMLDSAPTSTKKRKLSATSLATMPPPYPHTMRDDSFSSTGTPSALSNDLLKLFADEAFSDVKIVTSDQQEIKAHKLVLSARSEVFKTMLCGSMSESQSNEILLVDFEPAVVKAFVRYLYDDTLSPDTMLESGVDLYAMARKYHVVGLETQCEDYMGSILEARNVLEVLGVAELHESSSLRLKCLVYVGENSKTVVQNKSFMQQFDAYWTYGEASTTPATSAAVAVAVPSTGKGSDKTTDTKKKPPGTKSGVMSGVVSKCSSGVVSSARAEKSRSSASAKDSIASPLKRPRHIRTLAGAASGTSSAASAAPSVPPVESETVAQHNRHRTELLMVLGGVPVHELPQLSEADRAIASAARTAARKVASSGSGSSSRKLQVLRGAATTDPGVCTCPVCTAEANAARAADEVRRSSGPGRSYCYDCKVYHDNPPCGAVINEDEYDQDDEGDEDDEEEDGFYFEDEEDEEDLDDDEDGDY